MNKREILSENVYKEGNIIIKPIKYSIKNVHLLLHHLYNDGLPVPQVIKVDENFEYLEYIDGEVIYHRQWSNEMLFEIANLVKLIHNSAQTFKYSDSIEWPPNYLRELGDLKICSHGDITPWNIVTKGNKIAGLIDWECAGPICPIVELARVCWVFLPSLDNNSEEFNIIRAEQIRMMIDTYGLEKFDRNKFFDTMIDTIIYDTKNAVRNVTHDTVGKLWGIAWRNKNLCWMWQNKRLIKRILK